MKYIYLFAIILSTSAFGQTDLIMEDFQSGIPVNYTLVNVDGNTPEESVSEYTEAWISAQDPEDETNLVASSTSYFSPVGVANRWMITPQLNLGGFGNYMSWKSKSHDASYPDSYKVLVSTTDNQIESFTDTVMIVNNDPQYWSTYTANLTELGYDNASIYLAFVLKTPDGFKLYLDSLHVWIEDPLSIEKLNKTTISCYPNPFVDQLTIDASTPIKQIKIYSILGDILIETKEQVISTSMLTSGVYYVTVETDSGVETKQLIKR